MKKGDILQIPPQGVIYIYGLFDPRNNAIRYIGKTDNPAGRLFGHYTKALKGQGKQSPLTKWIADLIKDGVLPEMTILDIVPPQEWTSKEQEHIDDNHIRFGNLLNNDRVFLSKLKAGILSGTSED